MLPGDDEDDDLDTFSSASSSFSSFTDQLSSSPDNDTPSSSLDNLGDDDVGDTLGQFMMVPGFVDDDDSNS